MIRVREKTQSRKRGIGSCMVTILNRVVRVGVIVKVAFNEDFLEVKEVAINIEGKVFQRERSASAKALKWEHV